MEKVAEKISSLRAQLFPRTSYATAGSATSTLFVVVRDGDKVAANELALRLPDAKEFENCELYTSLEECLKDMDHHVLLTINPQAAEYAVLKSVLLDGKSKLCIILFTSKRKLFRNVVRDFEGAALTVDEFEYENANLAAIYLGHDATSSAATLLGFNGQPSVQSDTQFAYLWREQGLSPDDLESREQAKLRVLQRLSDHEVANKTKLPPDDWDKKIKALLLKRATDSQIYSMIRKVTLGKSLDEELSGGVSSTSPPAASLSSHTTAGEGDGRAEHLVELTVQCLPVKNLWIRKMLDYGCAEGAITAQIGKRLDLDASSIYGADVRAITAHEGYTFIQLPAESSGSDVEILSEIEEESLDFVNVAMVLHHVTNVEKVLQVLHSKISSDGVLLIREHDCHDAAMAAMLDITHGLYSLSWSTPVEWPDFIKEYQAFYRSREGWDDLLKANGFIRHEDPSNHTAVFQYNAAAASVFNEMSRRFPNVIRAYYAVYKKDCSVRSGRRTTKRAREEETQSSSMKRSRVQFVQEGEKRYVVMESKTQPGKFYCLDTATGTSAWM